MSNCCTCTNESGFQSSFVWSCNPSMHAPAHHVGLETYATLIGGPDPPNTCPFLTQSCPNPDTCASYDPTTGQLGFMTVECRTSCEAWDFDYELKQVCGIVGSCCFGSQWDGKTEIACALSGGVWLGFVPGPNFPEGSPNPCTTVYACCRNSDGVCFETTHANCPSATHKFWPQRHCTDVPSPCALGSCCGCDWCCDQILPGTCESQRTYPWEVLPEAHIPGCIGTNLDQCPVTPQKTNCRQVEFIPGKRPAAHEPPERGPGDAPTRIGRHELASDTPARAIDRAPGVEECRTFYAQPGKTNNVSTQKNAWLCGQNNRRLANTKRRNVGYYQRRPDGRFSFKFAYRVPCPEKPAVCL